MRNEFSLLIIGIFVIGCGQNPKTIKKDPNSRQVEIDFADISISLPKVFKRVSPDELIYSIENLDSTEISESDKSYKIERFETIKATKMKFYIYVDTTNINNTIIFLSEKYLKLDNEVRQYILSNADRTLKSTAVEQGIEVNRVDTQFFKGRKVETLKLKYEIKGPESSGYWTTYMVTTVSNSFQIFVTRNDNEDYEDRVTRMSIGLP